MFRVEFLNLVWEQGGATIKELAIFLHTTPELILLEAQICEEQGLIRIADQFILPTTLTDQASVEA
jgi:hypothetical protein